MKFSGYLPLYEDANAIDSVPDRSICWVGHALKVGQNELDCSSVCEWDREVLPLRLFNNLVLAVPKMGQVSKSVTFP